MKNKFTPYLIILISCLALACAGCASKVKDPYKGQHRPPKKTSSGKTPATQRPYTIKGKQYVPLATASGYVEKGTASWYGKKFHGRKTSNGETYNMYAMTAAHKTLPMNTWVRVENLNNGQQIQVRVNDRGPFVTGRIIDLSYSGAHKIGMVGPGTARVRVTALGRATSYSKKDHTPVAFKPVDYWKGNFTVQVGAFKVKTNAEAYRKKLSATYLNAHIVPYEDDRGQFYRVRIGKFSNLKDAVRFSDQLEGFGHTFAVAE
ncbi:MAG: septal ring lytic transglycosylase RlpA family protein [Desulfobacter sp.]|nr:septal ring lytic transglycosylase RlpA family protein [Desulfobacter sp.]WDP84073.1 MAG: septal ring lytic transglycosylase RlpA family protein [Desulfobacter sp.]